MCNYLNNLYNRFKEEEKYQWIYVYEHLNYTSRLKKLLTSYDAQAGLWFLGISNHRSLQFYQQHYHWQLSYAIKPKSLAQRVIDIQVSYPFSDVEVLDQAGEGLHTLFRRYTQTCKADKVIVIESQHSSFSSNLCNLKQCLVLIH
jgi:hypothetical protein